MDGTTQKHSHEPQANHEPGEGTVVGQRSLLLTVPEVADELRTSRSYVYRLIDEGVLPSVKIGRSVRVPRVELEAWIRDRTRQAVRT